MVHPKDAEPEELTASKLNDLDRTFAALADPTRRGTVDLLRSRPRRAGELAAALDLSPAAMSRHLRVLRQSGLVTEDSPEADARVRVYRLRPEHFAGLRTWLEQVEAFWAGELEAFRTYAERTRGRRRR